MSRSVLTGIFCPHCGDQIELRVGCRHERLLMAIRLQAERLGTEIYCDRCDLGFIYTRVHTKANSHTGGHHLNMSSSVDRQHAAEIGNC